MNAARQRAIESFGEASRALSADPFLAHATPDVVADWSASIGPLRGRYEGAEELRGAYRAFAEAFSEIDWQAHDHSWLTRDLVVFSTTLDARGRGSGVPTTGRGAQAWAFAGDKVQVLKVFQGREEALAWARRSALAEARLYFVTDGLGGAEGARGVVQAALEGGADVVQLRDRDLDRNALAETAAMFREAASAIGALFLVNDDPSLVGPFAADGVHVGQDDMDVAEARRIAGGGALVGLSTHSPDQLAGAHAAAGEARPDYLSVGPVWETPTKPGRPAAGLEYVRHAAAQATLPWFAIGGIDAGSVDQVVAAGAERIVVVRAIRDAGDPSVAAGRLRRAVTAAMLKSS